MKCFLFIAVIISSCSLSQRKGEVYMTDPDFVEFGREYSPDSTMILLNYGIDQGAFGYGRAGKAVLKLSDTTNNLRDFTIQNYLIKIYWLNNDTISAKQDIIPHLRSGKHFKIENQEVNGVTVLVNSFDYIEPDYERIIEYKEVSPDKKYDLVAYRYSKSRSALNFIHVSVIEHGKEIPKYGNFLIADMQSDYVFDGGWSEDNDLIFYTNELYSDLVQYYLVNNRPAIDYQLVVDNKRFGSKYRWIRKAE